MNQDKYHIGIVEDDKIMGELLKMKLAQNPHYHVQLFSSGEQLLQEKSFCPDVMILDYHLNSYDNKAMNGLQIARKISTVPKIVLSGEQDISKAIDFIHYGAFDYVVKDDQALEKLETSVAEIIEHLEQTRELGQLKRKNKRDLLRMFIALLLIVLIAIISTFF